MPGDRAIRVHRDASPHSAERLGLAPSCASTARPRWRACSRSGRAPLRDLSPCHVSFPEW